MAIKLLVGLGNPGKEYQSHRHNVGFWFCDALARLFSAHFKKEGRFLGETAQINLAGTNLHLLKPNVFMNHSGQSIQSLAKFYQLNTNEILIAHDDLDLSPGVAKLKLGGGHGGHNGLRDAIKALNGEGFHRLRIGIGHPGDKSQVVGFVLHPPTQHEQGEIQSSIANALQAIEDVVLGNIEKAMLNLHTKNN